MHLYPSQGKPRPAAKAIADMLFPKGAPTFPLVAVTGTNGKTTTVRMLNHILSLAGFKVGMTCSDGIYIDNCLVKKGDCSGPESARQVLLDTTVEAAVLEVARGGLIRGGLAYERADVGIITNITEDHLGLDGISTLDDMVFVKSLVAEQVKDTGYAVLNADDPKTVDVVKRLKGKIIFFSLQEDNLILKKHLDKGGRGVYVKNGTIYFQEQGKIYSLAKVTDLPSALKGYAVHNVQNALAAAAGAWGLQISLKTIAKGLMEFHCDENHNPGRMNIINLENVTVILDYGHNVKSLEAIINTAKLMRPSRLIGVIASPGNRRNCDIIKLGYVAGKGFNRLIIKEDENLRGKRPGEVAMLLQQGAQEAGLKGDKIQIILDEEEAITYSLENAGKGDIVVVFYENYEKALAAIKAAASSVDSAVGLPV